tara:strand:- start:309 stop:437 length:129 start_codon:yes stop_codon:yes gene_type:complete
LAVLAAYSYPAVEHYLQQGAPYELIKDRAGVHNRNDDGCIQK